MTGGIILYNKLLQKQLHTSMTGAVFINTKMQMCYFNRPIDPSFFLFCDIWRFIIFLKQRFHQGASAENSSLSRKSIYCPNYFIITSPELKQLRLLRHGRFYS